VKYEFINTHRHSYAVKTMCRMLRVSTSGFYAARIRSPSACSGRQMLLTSHIRAIHTASRHTYGAPHIHAELSCSGCCVQPKHGCQADASGADHAESIRRFRVITDSRNTKASPNLLDRVFQADRPNACRLSDITFIPTREGWLYLAAILDLYSRAIVGWDEQESRLPVG
jgi:putative transposase